MSEAASMIGVTDRRIRAMIADKLLTAERVGGRWIVTDTEVARLTAAPRRPGRPYLPAHAWGLLAIAGGRLTPWLSDPGRRRLVGTLEETSIDDVAPALRRRADPYHWYVHPGLLTDFVADPRTVVSGLGATGRLRHEGPDLLYVSVADIDALRSEYQPLLDAANPNATVHVVHSAWPFLKGEQVAWPAVVAVDLLDLSLDVRAQRVARDILERSGA